MLSQTETLVQQTEGRYASDTELAFLEDYATSYSKRLALYQKLQGMELTVVKAVYEKLQRSHPRLLRNSRTDLSQKWKRDTLRTIKYTAVTVLLDDPDTLQERYLTWFQTIMSAFKAQHSCEVTYHLMKEVMDEILLPEEAALVRPILDLNQTALGSVNA